MYDLPHMNVQQITTSKYNDLKRGFQYVCERQPSWTKPACCVRGYCLPKGGSLHQIPLELNQALRGVTQRWRDFTNHGGTERQAVS